MGSCSCGFFPKELEYRPTQQSAAPIRTSTFITQQRVQDCYDIDDHFQSTQPFTKRRAYSKSNSAKQYEICTIPKPAPLPLLLTELAVLRKLDHVNIQKVYQLFDTESAIHVVADLDHGVPLRSLLLERGRLPEPEAVHILKQVLSGVDYIHSKGISHRNLSLDTVRLAGSLVKIGGFANAKKFMVQGKLVLLDEAVGSQAFMAPEVSGGFYTSKCDLWSVGAIAYSLLFGTVGYALDGPVRIPRFQVSVKAAGFVQALLEVDLIRRLSAAQALEHDWLCGSEAYCGQ